MRAVFPPTPSALSAEEREWAAGAASAPTSPPTWADVTADLLRGHARNVPWRAPAWDAGVDGREFVPGFVRQHTAFWEQVILRNHPHRRRLVSYLREGVDLRDFLREPYRGPSDGLPYAPERFPGATFANRVPPKFAGFVDREVQTLVDRGCVVKWDDVRTPGGPARPRLVMALSVEESKPRLIYDGRPLNARLDPPAFSMDTVARVANVAAEGCYMTSLDDSSAFHHILIHPSSWPLLGFEHDGVLYCWCVLPFGLSVSPWCYHVLSDAKASFLRSLGIPALAYLDDSWQSNPVDTQGLPAREQWSAAGEATHRGMLVSFLCGHFLSLHKCDLRPTTEQLYLGILCDSRTASFRVPQDKLDKLHALIRAALDDGWLAFRTLQRIAGKCMSMTVAIRPASLWTHALFQAITALDKSGVSGVDLSRDRYADLRGELLHWLSIASTTHEGPWQRARHFKAALTGGASDASSVGWGGIVYAADGPFRAGAVFPPDWLTKHINQKEMYALYHMLRQYCERHPEALRRAQVLIDVDNQSVVGAFARGRARNGETHALLVQLFDLQVQYGFLLSLKWVPTDQNEVADAISRPSRDSTVRLAPDAFGALWEALGPFNVDLMACSASAQCSPVSGFPLPFFSHFDCPGSAGVDVLAHNVAVVPGTVEEAFGFCFPPPVMVGHVVQHLAECKAHAVVVVPDRQEYWFPMVRHAAVRRREVAQAAAPGSFHWPSADGLLRPWRYLHWAMVAYEVDFRQ